MSEGGSVVNGGAEAPVRVYVGSQEAQLVPVKVLEHSIRKHTDLPVEIFPLHHAHVDFPMPVDVKNRPRTPFSFQRFYIPKLAGFRGRAIYLDSDMQVFKDIGGLWGTSFDGADLLSAWDPGESGRRPQFSVMLLNCDVLRWDLHEIVKALDRGDLTYETLMYEMQIVPNFRASIDPSWNSLEQYEEGRTALLHYTDMTIQPWVSRDNPRGHLWVRDLIEAVDGGFIGRDLVEAHVREGYLRPSLLFQLDNRIEHTSTLPSAAVALDSRFVPPYKLMGGHAGATPAGLLQRTRSFLRRAYERTPFFRRTREFHKAKS